MSINGKFVYSIELDTMQDARDMVAIATKLKGKILLKSGTKFTINAKSLLGVIYAKQLNWCDVKLICDFDYYREFEKFIVTGDPVVVEDEQ